MRRELLGGPDPVDRTRFPVDEWAWRETWYSTDDLGQTETAFAVGNGYLGLRGNVEEGRDVHAHGTFINGFHETWQIRHAEEAFGFAQTGQTIVNVPDVKTIKLYVDDEPLMLSMADLSDYERTLDFRDGVLRRSLVWRTPSGKRVLVESTRMVSFEQRHLAVMTFEVTLLDQDAPVAISSQILNREDGTDEYHVSTGGQGFDPRKASTLVERVLDPQSHWTSQRRTVLSYKCVNSGMTLAVAVDHELVTESEYEELSHVEEDLGKKIYRVKGTVGQPIRLTKVAAYHSSRGVPTRRARRPRPAHPRPGPRHRRRRLPRGAAPVARPFLARLRRRGAGPPRHPAGGPLEPLPARPGLRPHRAGRGARQGRQRVGLRGPLLLGRRDLRPALPQLHLAVGRPWGAALPLPHAPGRAPPRRRAVQHRRPLPVAHDQRRGGIGLLRGRHGAVPHQRRHRLRPLQVRAAPAATRTS